MLTKSPVAPKPVKSLAEQECLHTKLDLVDAKERTQEHCFESHETNKQTCQSTLYLSTLNKPH